MRGKRFLTLFWYDDIGEQHLYKDVGGIPYALAKYRGWKAVFAYSNINGTIRNKSYEKYVDLIPINLFGKSKFAQRQEIIKFLWSNAENFDVLNIYHWQKWTFIYCLIAKLRNPNIKTYVKLDMDRKGFKAILRNRWWDVFAKYVDLFTVETKKYVDLLNKQAKFLGRISYLPNGFFSDLVTYDFIDIKKERIMLSVGRLGTIQKNTELLVNAFVKLDEAIIKEWRLYLVGPYTDAFYDYIQNIIHKYPPVKDKIVLTGNIYEKSELYRIYKKASIFVLTSRYEGYPLVIPEALYYGCKVITTDSFPAANEVIKEINGLVVGHSEDEVVCALKKIIAKGVDYDNKKITDYACKNLNWSVLVKKLEKCLI